MSLLVEQSQKWHCAKNRPSPWMSFLSPTKKELAFHFTSPSTFDPHALCWAWQYQKNRQSASQVQKNIKMSQHCLNAATKKNPWCQKIHVSMILVWLEASLLQYLITNPTLLCQSPLNLTKWSSLNSDQTANDHSTFKNPLCWPQKSMTVNTPAPHTFVIQLFLQPACKNLCDEVMISLP